MTYRECYENGRAALAEAGIEEAALDARLLLEYICNTNRNDLLVHGERPVEVEQQERYNELIAKRSKRIPLQHLTGVQNFMGLDFQVNEHVLIPRQDTEVLVEEVLRNLHDGMRILDMCTGSGCILISLLHFSNECQGVGVDISEEALTVARENALKLLGEKPVEWFGDNQIYRKHRRTDLMEATTGEKQQDEHQEDADVRVTQIGFVQSDLFEKVSGKFDIVVSNPPYIRSDVIPTLMPEVKEHEPMQALDGMEDGLFFYRKIVEESRSYLNGGGWLYFEIGHDQAAEVSELMQDAGFSQVTVVKDFAGLDRVVYGNWL